MSTWIFLRPLWLLLLPLVVITGWWMARLMRQPRTDWQKIVDPDLLQAQVTPPTRWPWLGLSLIITAFTLAVIALAGLSTHRAVTPFANTSDTRLIVMDISRSMYAQDIVPSRMVAAQRLAATLLDSSVEQSVGLMAYAGDAWMVVPITRDRQTVAALLDIVDPSLAPVQGSRPDRALSLALTLIQRSHAERAEIVLFTDGFAGEKVFAIAERVVNLGHQLTVIASGTRDGARIPLKQGGYLRNIAGETVVTRVSSESVQRLAAIGNRDALWLANAGAIADPSQVESFAKDDLDNSTSLDLATTQPRTDNPEGLVAHRDDGVWLLLPLLLLAAVAFRRGVLFCIPLLVFLQPLPAQAQDTDSGWWWRSDQRVAHAVKRQDFDQAFKLAPDGEWLGIVSYRRGDYESAAVFFGGSDTADSHYNRGNALVKLARFEQALEAYNIALRRDPHHADALYNRDLVLAYVDEQQSRDGQQAGSELVDAPSTDDRSEEESPVTQTQNSDDASASQSSESQAGTQQSTPSAELDSLSDQRRAPQYSEQPALSEQDLDVWLQQIPEDPGGWLRRRFYRTQQQRNRRAPVERSDAW